MVPGKNTTPVVLVESISGIIPERRLRVTAARAAWREVATAATATGAYVPLAESRVQLLAGQRLRNGLVMGPYTSYDLATAGVR